MSFQDVLLIYAASVLAVLSLMALIFLVYFIICHEIIKQGEKLSWTLFFTPFSTLLLLMIICQIGLYLCEVFILRLQDIRKEPGLSPYFIACLLQNLCSVVTESTYISYSFLRAKPIIQKVFPKLSTTIALIVKISPLLFAAQWIPYPFAGIEFQDEHTVKLLISATRYMSMLNGLFLISFDAFCLVTFIYYLRSTQVDEGIDERFLIISRYGIMSVGVCFSALASYIVYAFVEAEIWQLVVYFHFSALFCVLFRMKVVLHHHKLVTGASSHVVYASVANSTGTGRERRGSLSPRPLSFVLSNHSVEKGSDSFSFVRKASAATTAFATLERKTVTQ